MPALNTTDVALFLFSSDGLLEIKSDNAEFLTTNPSHANKEIDLMAVVGVNKPARLQATFTVHDKGYIVCQEDSWPTGCDSQAQFLIGSVYPSAATMPVWPTISAAHYGATAQPKSNDAVCEKSITVTFASHGLIEVRMKNSLYTINLMGVPTALGKKSYLIAFGGRGTIDLEWTSGANIPVLAYTQTSGGTPIVTNSIIIN